METFLTKGLKNERSKNLYNDQRDEEGFYKTLKLDANGCNDYDILFAGYTLFNHLAKQDPNVSLISTVCNAVTAASNLIKKDKQNEDKDNHSDSDESK